MKGLILKDLYMTVHYFRKFLFILILFLGLGFADGENLFMVFYPGLLATMIPVNLLAYDERSRWDIYCGTLPVSRDKVVSAKYLLELILLGVVYLLTIRPGKSAGTHEPGVDGVSHCRFCFSALYV